MKKYLDDKEVKSQLLTTMKCVDRYLRDNGIKYSIYAGTLLGAVRHSGFIPWDDDIDIVLSREEYDKLLVQLLKDKCKINDSIFAAGFELGNDEIPFIKIKNKNIIVEDHTVIDGYNRDYLWIDVWPIDEVPDIFPRAYLFLLGTFYKNAWCMKRFDNHGWKNTEDFFSKIVRKLFSNYPYDRLTQKIIKFAKIYSNGKHKNVTNVIWGIGYKEIFPKEFMSEYQDYSFENFKFRGMTNADAWLKIRYGDYMKLPPKEQQISHGIVAWEEIDDEK